MSLKLKFFLLIAISLWLTGIFIEFLISYFHELSFAYPFSNRIYSTVCHQQVEKLIVFNGHTSLVCSRCSGIYFGGFISSLILLFVKQLKLKNGKYILLAAIPMLLDVLLYSVGIYTYSKFMALITGFLFGFAGIVYIYNGFQILNEKND